MSIWYSKHVEESNSILRINNIQCITLAIIVWSRGIRFSDLNDSFAVVSKQKVKTPDVGSYWITLLCFNSVSSVGSRMQDTKFNFLFQILLPQFCVNLNNLRKNSYVIRTNKMHTFYINILI